MKELLKSHHPVRHFKSFKHAFRGIIHTTMHEANFRIQILIVTVAIYLGFHFKISHTDWGLLILSNGILLIAELMNTVIEEFMDHLVQEHHEGIRIVKDVSAGFVLVTAFTALAILVLIFGHYFVTWFSNIQINKGK